MENNIYFSNISKSFDGKIVLDNLSHGFKLNQVHVILGKSGMGKSVLLKRLKDSVGCHHDWNSW